MEFQQQLVHFGTIMGIRATRLLRNLTALVIAVATRIIIPSKRATTDVKIRNPIVFYSFARVPGIVPFAIITAKRKMSVTSI